MIGAASLVTRNNGETIRQALPNKDSELGVLF